MNFDFFGNIGFYIFVVMLLAIIFLLKKYINKNGREKITEQPDKDKTKEISTENIFLTSEIKRLNYIVKEYKNKIDSIREIGGNIDYDILHRNDVLEKVAADKELNELYEEKKALENDKIKFQNRNKKLWEQSIAIHKEKERIDILRQEIERRHKEVTDSIKYAQRIQTALMPSDNLIKEFLPEHFIMWKPRDIVSGDFYWTKKIENLIYLVAADCTGHGVPGALMSMLGMAFLNEIIKDKQLTANTILDDLRIHIKKSLKQTGAQRERKDGMDMALCIIDTETNIMQFAGANNHLYLIRNNKLIRYRANSMPIGVYIREKPFKNNEIKLNRNDIFYIFSDGFQDQFGGERNFKYKSKQFKEFLLKIHLKKMNEQKQLLEDEFDNWKGEKLQLDDVLIIGIKM